MLTQIKAQGFKCFDNMEIELNNLTLFTGINSAGKSSVIQAILLLIQQRDGLKNPLNGKYVRLGEIRDIKNSITNPKMIKIQSEEDTGIEKSVCLLELNLDGEAKISGREMFSTKDFIYLSAGRVGAEDVYAQNLTYEYRIGVQGEYAFDYLSRERLNELRESSFRHPDAGANLGNQVDYWLNYILGYYVTAEQISGTEIVRVSYRREGNGSKEIKPYHVGTGVSYAASVIISALSCKNDSLFIVENPEIHLHPGAQSRLLDFLGFMATRGLQIIVETHSDHIFNGVRKNLKAKNLAPSDVSVYFFKQDEDFLSRPVKICIDENGIIQNHEKGLFDQFDEDLDELLGL